MLKTERRRVVGSVIALITEKRKEYVMKKLVLIITAIFFMSGTFAQEKKEDKKAARKERAKAERIEESRLTKTMLENRNFVLESDYLQNKYGDRFFVNSNINFIKVDSATAVIQVGSDYGIGHNGVGGVTAEGQITKWDLKENSKNKSYYLAMSVMTPIGIYDLSFNISPTGDATARLTGLRSGSLTFEGELVPAQMARVYEGSSI